MLNRVLCIVQCWNISIVTSIKLFQSTSCNLLKNKIAHSLLSNGFFTELNRTLQEQNVNNYLKPSHLLSWFHATQEYATQYTLNPRLIENTLLAQFCKFLRVWKGILGSGIWPEIYCKTRENAKFFERDTRFDRYSRGGIRQSLGAGWFIRKKAVFGRDDRRSKCGIVVIRTPPLPDPGSHLTARSYITFAHHGHKTPHSILEDILSSLFWSHRCNAPRDCSLDDNAQYIEDRTNLGDNWYSHLPHYTRNDLGSHFVLYNARYSFFHTSYGSRSYYHP